MNSIYVAVLILIISSVAFAFVGYWILRDQAEKIVEAKKLEKSKTYYSIGGIRRLLIYSFVDEGLYVMLKSNIFMPKVSLVGTESTIKYDQIKKIDIGQSTATLKLADTVSLDSILYRYNMGGMASFNDGPFRMVFTSKKTRENFMQELTNRGVNYSDLSTTKGSALTLILVTLFVIAIAAGAIYYTVF